MVSEPDDYNPKRTTVCLAIKCDICSVSGIAIVSVYVLQFVFVVVAVVVQPSVLFGLRLFFSFLIL
jgi:hypothetical protein